MEEDTRELIARQAVFLQEWNKHVPSRVTIICDASWDKGCAGIGFHINGDTGIYIGSASAFAQTSGSAEVLAIFIAVNEAMRIGRIKPDDILLIQSDSTYAIERGPRMVFPWPLTIRFRHVRGHTDVQDSRSHAQRGCDTRARNALRRMLANVEQTGRKRRNR